MRVLDLVALGTIAACAPSAEGELASDPEDKGASEFGRLELPRCETTEPEGNSVPWFPSTLVGTLEPPLAEPLEYDRWKNPSTWRGEKYYREMGLMDQTFGDGRPHLERRDLVSDVPKGDSGSRRSLAYFVQMSDLQLPDDESSNRATVMESATFSSAMRPQEAYLPRAVSAMNRTLAELERPDRPYDIGIVTGDCADSAQRNELEWVLQIMGGDTGVHTDSGADDDPIDGADNDPKDPFDAVAFPAPWLFVPGNHDTLVQGHAAIDPLNSLNAIGVWAELGTRHYEWWFAPSMIGPVLPDWNRALLQRKERTEILLEDWRGQGPAGHGYAEARAHAPTHFVYDAVPGLLRIIGLDTTNAAGDKNGILLQETVDTFLEPELTRARDEGLLVVLASHHAALEINADQGLFGNRNALDTTEVEAVVASHPEIILWIAGHKHTHRIRPLPWPNGSGGVWEVVTAGMMDWPNQVRLFEVVDNGDGTLSIYGTLVDFHADACLERRFRRLAQMDHLAGWARRYESHFGSDNVELIVKIPDSAIETVRAARGFERIESLTTLREI